MQQKIFYLGTLDTSDLEIVNNICYKLWKKKATLLPFQESEILFKRWEPCLEASSILLIASSDSNGLPQVDYSKIRALHKELTIGLIQKTHENDGNLVYVDDDRYNRPDFVLDIAYKKICF